jgi:hypothetical protein
LCAIERLIKKEIERVDHPLASSSAPSNAKFPAKRHPNRAMRGRMH